MLAFRSFWGKIRLGAYPIKHHIPEVERFQKLLSPLFYPSPALRADRSVLAANSLGQPGLWAFGISGDYPILLVRLNHEEEVVLLLEVMQAYALLAPPWIDDRCGNPQPAAERI